MTSGFLALIDDIALLMDDVLILSKVATKKTAGILADDLAINADKDSGFTSNRELPVLWITLLIQNVVSYFLQLNFHNSKVMILHEKL